MLSGEHNDYVEACCWSPDGAYLASVDRTGEVLIWCVQSRQSIHRYRHSEPIYGIDWSPNSCSELAFMDVEGQYTVWSDCIPKTQHTQASEQMLKDRALEEKKNFQSLFSDSDESDSDDAYGLQDMVASKPHQSGFFDDETDESDSDVPVAASSSDERVQRPLTTTNTTRSMRYKRRTKDQPPQRIIVNTETAPRPFGTKDGLHPSFQPSTTPFNRKRAFLCWNSVGSVHSVDEDSHYLLTVEFADKSNHSPKRFKEEAPFTMCALAEHGCVFACAASNNYELLSVIQYRSFGNGDEHDSAVSLLSAAGTDNDWMMPLDRGESAKSVAIGKHWVAVGTSKQMVRVMGVSGMQNNIFSLGGHIVTMVGTDSHLAVVYQPDCRSTQLRVLIFNVAKRHTLYNDTLPLSGQDKCKLQWITFDQASKNLITLDTQGVFRMLSLGFCDQWMPILDIDTITRTHTEQSVAALSQEKLVVWPVGVDCSEQVLFYVECDTMQPEPCPLPVPLVSTHSLCIPVVGKPLHMAGNTQQKPIRQLEEEVLRNTVCMSGLHFDDPQLHARAVAMADRSKLQLFKSDLLASNIRRAYDICARLSLQKSLNIAKQMAEKLQKFQLVEKIDQLIEDRVHATDIQVTSSSTTSTSIEKQSRTNNDKQQRGNNTQSNATAQRALLTAALDASPSYKNAKPKLVDVATRSEVVQRSNNPFIKRTQLKRPLDVASNDNILGSLSKLVSKKQKV
mmetsp:Transcript_21248/g.31628  ORF Transcript_21248/g.31628 Transcript_21248/m.31628 type:complete len:733 (+) Transcript_21248:516-2714(+)